MSLDFVAIDFEIAAPKWDTVCSVALARVRNGKIVEEYSTYINPECEFGPIQMRVHGITPIMVASSPTFPEVSTAILDFIGNDVIVAHNIPFDGNVLQRVLIKYGIAVPKIKTFCTLACSNLFDPSLSSHRLPAVCAKYDIQLGRHHDALSDTRACAEIMIAIANKMEAHTLDDAAAFLHMQYGEINQYSVISPRLTNGKPVYLSGPNALPARNPFAILEGIRTKCPDISNEITIDQLKDGKTVVFKVSGSLLFYITIGTNSTFIKIPEISSPESITPRTRKYSDGAIKLPVDQDFNYDLFIDVVADRCKLLYELNLTSSFGCCNDFLLCSDAKKCLKSDDPFYKGCIYRKNLETGKIFYGVNRTV